MTENRKGISSGPAVQPETQALAAVLPDNKRAVLDLLRVGKSISETARTAGIDRGTIYRWMKDDVQFCAAYNQWRDETEEFGRSRLAMLTEAAIDSLEAALKAGDARAAMQLLIQLGLFKQRALLTNATELEQQAKLEEKRKRFAFERENRKIDLDDQTSRMIDGEVSEMFRMDEKPRKAAAVKAPEGTGEEQIERWWIDGDRILKKGKGK